MGPIFGTLFFLCVIFCAVCLSVCLSVCSVCLSVCVSALSVCESVCLLYVERPPFSFILEPEFFCFCTLPDFLHPKRYKIQGGTPAIFLFSFGVRPSIHTLPQISTNFAPVLVFLGYFCGGGTPYGRWKPTATQR